jgi:predicted metal-dependent hydrolase
MSTKKEKIAGRVRQWHGRGVDPHFLGYFYCFNRGLYYEAHDVLEQLGLKDRHGANGAFYKGLIQLAGAFVHLQKNRLRPAAALFKLAATNLQKYPDQHEQIDLRELKALTARWIGELEAGAFKSNPLNENSRPNLVGPA